MQPEWVSEKNHSTSTHTKITQTLHTQNHSTSQQQQNHATSPCTNSHNLFFWSRNLSTKIFFFTSLQEIARNLCTKKSSNLFKQKSHNLLTQKITQSLYKKITQPLRKTNHETSRKINHATWVSEWEKWRNLSTHKISCNLSLHKITQPLFLNHATSLPKKIIFPLHMKSTQPLHKKIKQFVVVEFC